MCVSLCQLRQPRLVGTRNREASAAVSAQRAYFRLLHSKQLTIYIDSSVNPSESKRDVPIGRDKKKALQAEQGRACQPQPGGTFVFALGSREHGTFSGRMLEGGAR